MLERDGFEGVLESAMFFQPQLFVLSPFPCYGARAPLDLGQEAWKDTGKHYEGSPTHS